MIKIKKGKEPREWTEYCSTPGVDFEGIKPLREALLQEQGYICAYCMRRIPNPDGNSNEETRIDHIKSQKDYPDLKLKYNNLVICCPGAINNDFHCDKKKEERAISFDLFSDQIVDTLSYRSDGRIESSNKVWDKEINDVLNLNNPMLMLNRKNVIAAIIDRMGKNKKGWTAKELQEQLKSWENMSRIEEDEEIRYKYKAFCGVVVYYLKKKLKLLK